MTGRSELGFPKTSRVVNLKHQLVMATLRCVKSLGHCYVDVREDGKKLMFFCTLCLAQCHSTTNLFDHLKGKPHNKRLVSAKATLWKPNPWPFDDGFFFFHVNPREQNIISNDLDTEKVKLLKNSHMRDNSLAIVSSGSLGQKTGTHTSLVIDDHVNEDDIFVDSNQDGQENTRELVIPGVLQNDKVSDLVVSHMGVGTIGARFIQNDGVSEKIHRIWCEWLGNKNVDSEDSNVVPEHDFAIVTFAYDVNLGRKDLFDGFKLPFSPHSELEDVGSSRGKKKKSFSDPGDTSNPYESSGEEEESQSSNSSNVKKLLSGNDDQLVHKRVLSSKKMRKAYKEQQEIASARVCDICQQKFLPHKDVAALLNRRTGKLICSSRNLNGAFHVFHVSCLIRWVLVCEVEIFANQSAIAKPIQDLAEEEREIQEKTMQICSAFCPECRGTGMEINLEVLEKPRFSFYEMYRCKIKLCDANREWMRSPEELEHCSMGFRFPPQSHTINEETVSSLKLLRFYRAKS